jgi:sulfur-oxidizing protein SoxZ
MSTTDAAPLGARVSLPERAAPGETVEVRTLASHPMETGYRIDTRGERVPRRILERLRCRYDGRLVFDAELRPAIAANPYVAFAFVADRSGDVVLEWVEDTGRTLVETRRLTVEAP